MFQLYTDTSLKVDLKHNGEFDDNLQYFQGWYQARMFDDRPDISSNVLFCSLYITYVHTCAHYYYCIIAVIWDLYNMYNRINIIELVRLYIFSYVIAIKMNDLGSNLQ